MRGRQRSVVLALLLLLVAAACGGGERRTEPVQTETSTVSTRPAPTFPPGTTMARIQAKGKIVVGTKFDQPGFGLKDPTTGELTGFDVEMAKLVALGIFGGDLASMKDKVEFVETVSRNREAFIQQGRVDLVIATYTINDARKQVVDFAGPYFVAQQDLMVKSDDNSIRSVDDLGGKKVCTVRGSTSETNLKAKAPRASVTLFDTYSLCAEALRDGRAVAVTTDNTILAGLVKESGGALKLVGSPFSEEPYGMGMKKGEQAWRDFLNDWLEEIFADGEWRAAFQRTLGTLGLQPPQPPAVDRYTSTTAPSTTTTSRRPTTTTTRRPTTTSSTTAGTTTTATSQSGGPNTTS